MKKLLPLILAGFLSAGAVEAEAISHQEIPSQVKVTTDPPALHKM